MATSCLPLFISTVTMLRFSFKVFLCESSYYSVNSYNLAKRVSICRSTSPLFS